MVTNQIMVRQMEQYEVLQRTSDGYFNATGLLDQFQKTKEGRGKRMDDYLSSKGCQEFIRQIELKEGIETTTGKSAKVDTQLIKTHFLRTKGRSKKIVYMHPMLFIDFVMWLNAEFKYNILKFVYDHMIFYRDLAGDAYKSLSLSVKALVDAQGLDMRRCMAKVAEGLNWIVFNKHSTEIRNQFGEESKMMELFDLEKKLADLINDGFITRFDELVTYMRRLYCKKRTNGLL